MLSEFYDFCPPTYVQNITFHKDSRFLFQPCIRVLIYTHSHIPFQLHTPVSLDYLPAANNIFSPAFIFYSVFSHQGSNNHESFSMPSRFLFLCSEAQGLFSNCSFFRYSRSNFIFFVQQTVFSWSFVFLEISRSTFLFSLSTSLSIFISLHLSLSDMSKSHVSHFLAENASVRQGEGERICLIYKKQILFKYKQ